MAAAVKHETPRAHPKESSVVSLLSGWTQQGVQTLFATQRILIDLAMRQNASIMHAIREQLTDPHHSPTAILSEIAGDGINNFIAGQKILLDLGKQQNEILMNGIKERVGNQPVAEALADLLRRGVDTFIDMQEQFLKTAGKQSQTWLQAAKIGKPYQPEQFVHLAREGMETFVNAQKKFLDVISQETAKATGKGSNGTKKIKKTELAELARQATESFIEAQKRLIDVAGEQMNASMNTAGKTLELLRPFPFLPVNELTREAVKSYVDAQKALMDVMVRRPQEKTVKGETRARKPAKSAKAAAAATA
jgi:hypothetical protein